MPFEASAVTCKSPSVCTSRPALTVLRRMLVVASLASGAAMAQTAAEPTVVEVRRGDTFSGIAARFTGQARLWSQLYNPRLTGLSNPNHIIVGMRFELVTEGGSRYLRLVVGRPDAAVATAPAPAPAPAPVAVAPAPAVVAAPAPAAPPPPPAPSPAPAAAAAAAVAPLVAAAGGGAAAADDALVIGVLPNIGAAALQAQYDNLKGYFERTQSQKVRIVIPPNFKAFFDSTMRGDFDLSVAAPHFARVAQLDRGMVPLVAYEPRINAFFISTQEDKITGPADIRNKAVGFANPTSLVALYGLQWFRQQGVEPGKDVGIRGARTDMGVGRMLLTGEVAAAVMSNGEFRALPQDESSRLRVVETFARIPNFIIVANPKLGAARITKLRTQFKGFMADKDEGAAFLKATGLTGAVDADDATLRELDAYVAPTRRAMGYGQ